MPCTRAYPRGARWADPWPGMTNSRAVLFSLRDNPRAQRTNRRRAHLDDVAGLQEPLWRRRAVGQQFARIRSRSCCRAAADHISRIKREIARQIFEIFAKREYHIACIEPLTALPVDQRLHIDVRRISLADDNTRA